jgi:hypothetical protein
MAAEEYFNMNHFGRMADDLTSLEMSLDGMTDLPHAKALKAALQRAFIEACKASRAHRLSEEQTKTARAAASPARKYSSAAVDSVSQKAGEAAH